MKGKQASRSAMEAREKHWKWCKENKLDIWQTKLGGDELC